MNVVPSLASNIANTGYIFMIVNFILVGLFIILVILEFTKHKGKFHTIVPYYSALIEIFVFFIAVSFRL